jgi:hypothetical protein
LLEREFSLLCGWQRPVLRAHEVILLCHLTDSLASWRRLPRLSATPSKAIAWEAAMNSETLKCGALADMSGGTVMATWSWPQPCADAGSG